MSLSVIIPSRNAVNLRQCVTDVCKHEPEAKIIVVDDGVDWEKTRCADWVGVRVLPGQKPFIFARNVNLGIRAAGEDDVVLLNDDALLESDYGFSLMQEELELHQQFAICGATTNVTGYPDQLRRVNGGDQIGLRETKRLAFLCVYIPRRTIHRIGLLDERYTTYGGEDIDYCRQVREAKLKCAVHDGCYVDHGSLTPTFRATPRSPGDCRQGFILYGLKWGDLA